MKRTLLADRYELLDTIGRGGMARVHRARDVETGKTVAVKILVGSGGSSNSDLARFKREFTVCRDLRHPNIVELLDYGTLEEDSPFIVMELLSGRDLDELIRDLAPLPPERVRTIVEQMVSALSCIHAAGLVHRDLKPSNIFVTAEGWHNRGKDEVTLLDFGLARKLDATALTETGALLGTPYYMSPELVNGDKADRRSDIWQLGVITFELLTGQRPFSGDDLSTVLAQILVHKPPLPSSLVPGLEPCWDRVVATCLCRDPKERYGRVEEISAAIASGGHGGMSNGPVQPASAPPEPSPASTTTGARTAVTERPRQRSLLPALAVVIFVIALVAMTLGGGETVYTVRDLHIEAGLTSLQLSWHSDEAYPTHVRFASPHEAVYDTGDRATTDHRLLVRNLAEDNEYSFHIVYPSGEQSLRYTARTALFECVPQRYTADGVSQVLQWQIRPTTLDISTSLLQVRQHGNKLRLFEGRRLSPASARVAETTAPAAVLYSTVLPAGCLTADTEEAVIETVFGDGRRRQVYLAPALTEWSRAQTRLAAGFSSQQVLRGLNVPHWSTPTVVARPLLEAGKLETDRHLEAGSASLVNRQIGELRRTVTERLSRHDLLRKRNEAAALAPLVFSTTLVPLADRLALYRALLPYRDIALFASLAGLDGEAIMTIDDGRFGRLLGKQARARVLARLFVTKDEKLYIGKRLPFRNEHRNHPTWTAEFTLSQAAMDSLSAGEDFALDLHIRRWHRCALRVIVNDRFETVLGGAYVLYDDEDRRVHLYQQLPRELLVVGTNEIELRHETFVPGGDRPRVTLQGVAIVALPRSGMR